LPRRTSPARRPCLARAEHVMTAGDDNDGSPGSHLRNWRPGDEWGGLVLGWRGGGKQSERGKDDAPRISES
jgi:hypothetical protein